MRLINIAIHYKTMPALDLAYSLAGILVVANKKINGTKTKRQNLFDDGSAILEHY